MRSTSIDDGCVERVRRARGMRRRPRLTSPVVRIAEAAKPSPVRGRWIRFCPRLEELAIVLGSTGMMGQLVEGGPDMLLAGVGESDATPIDCVSPSYRLEKVVYQASPVQSVASQPWTGGRSNGPPTSGFFGVVQFATPDDAQAFFAASADKWHRCNGQTLVLHQPEHGADGSKQDHRCDRRRQNGVGRCVCTTPARRSSVRSAWRRIALWTWRLRTPTRRRQRSDAAGRVANLMLQKIGIS